MLKKLRKSRKIINVDVDAFNADIHNSFLNRHEDFVNVSNAVKVSNDVLGDLVNKNTPFKEHRFTVRQNFAWHTSEIRQAKHARKKAERLYQCANLPEHKRMFVEAQQQVNSLVECAKTKYYSSKMEEPIDTNPCFRLLIHFYTGSRILNYTHLMAVWN